MQKHLLSDIKDFVIREDVLNTLTKIYDDVKKDGLRFVLLEGPFGSGKTTLVEYFSSNLDCHYIKIQGIRQSVPEPFLPFRTLLDVTKEYGYEKLYLRRSGPEKNFMDKIKYLLQSLANEKVVLLFVDDANYLDESSITMLIYLRYSLEKEKIMIICAYRSDEEGLFKNIIPRLLSDSRTSHIVLRKLPYEVFKKILLDKLEYHFHERVLKELYEASGGQPYYLNELLRLLIETGVIDKERKVIASDISIVDLDLPTNITSIVLHKFNNLSECCRKLLYSASVFGMSFEFEDVVEVSELGECALDALEEAIRAGLIVENMHRYEFISFQVMKSIYDSMILEKRKKLHNKIAEYLEKKGANIYSLAVHYYKGGNVEKAKKFLLEAVRESQRLGSYSESLKFIRMLKSLGFYNSEIRYREGVAHCTIGNYLRGAELLLSIPRDSEYYVDAVLLGASVLESMGERSVAANILLELFESTAHNIKVASKLITTFSRLGYLDKAKRILDILDAPKDEVGRYYFEKAHAIYNAYSGNIEEALKHFIECKKYIEKMESMEIERVRSYSNLGAIYSTVGDIKNSEMYYREALRLAEEIGYIEGIIYSYMNWGDSLRFYGEIERAESIIERATQLSKAFGHWDVYSGCKVIHGWILLEKGAYEKSIEVINEVLTDSSKKSNDAYNYSEMWLVLAYSSLCLDDKNWLNFMKNAIETQPQRIKRLFWTELLKFELDQKENLIEYYDKLPIFEKIIYAPFVLRSCIVSHQDAYIEKIENFLRLHTDLPRARIIIDCIDKIKNRKNEEFEEILNKHGLKLYIDLFKSKGII